MADDSAVLMALTVTNEVGDAADADRNHHVRAVVYEKLGSGGEQLLGLLYELMDEARINNPQLVLRFYEELTS